MFLEFITIYGRSYQTKEEFKLRLEVFRNSLNKIKAHPKNSTSQIGVNQFADWTNVEFKKMLGDHDFKPNEKKNVDLVDMVDELDLPKSVNWTA